MPEIKENKSGLWESPWHYGYVGDIDVITAGDRSSEISWWRNNGGTPLTWTKLVLSAKFYGAWGLHAGDIDGDGDYDIVGGSTREIVWWENTQIE